GADPVRGRCRAGAGVGEFSQAGPVFPNYLGHVLFGFVGGVGEQGPELAEPVGRIDEVFPLLVEHCQRVGDRLERPIDDGLLRGQLPDQAVQTLRGRDDISGLVVEIRGESVQLLYQASEILLAAPERGTERLGDVLQLADSAAVEHRRQRRQRLLGGRVQIAVRQRDYRAVVQLALWWRVFRRRQLDMLRAERAGLAELGSRVVG